MSDLPLNLQAARFKVAHDWPYLQSVFWRINWREAPIPTMGVDKFWRGYFGRQYAEETSVEELVKTLRHEADHLMRDHPGRMEPLDGPHLIKNIAADLPINIDMRTEGCGIDKAVYPEHFNLPEGLTAEEYLERLLDQAQKGKVFQPGSGPGAGNCGSCAHGGHEEHEEGAGGENGDRVSETEAGLIRKEVAREIREHMSKHPGTVPGHWQRWADQVLTPPKVPWQTILARVLRANIATLRGLTDYSYTRPSRRQSVSKDIIYPAMVRPTIEVAAVVDTSGSIDDGQIVLAVSEVEGVCRTVGQPVTVLGCDTQVHSTQRVVSGRQVRELGGGGGTDMGRGIERAMELRPRPDLVIVITDGWTPWPAGPPRSKVVVALLPGGSDSVPGWAETVRME